MTIVTIYSRTGCHLCEDALLVLESMKAELDFEIKEVFYNKKDSSFNVAITNKDNVIREHSYSIDYFNKFYGLNAINEIEGIYLYEYKKGKSFKNEDYKEYLICDSKNLSKRIEKFEKSGYEYDIKSLEKQYISVKGHVQSGKTEFMTYMSTLLLTKGFSVIIMLRNMEADREQIYKRITNFYKDYKIDFSVIKKLNHKNFAKKVKNILHCNTLYINALRLLQKLF